MGKTRKNSSQIKITYLINAWVFVVVLLYAEDLEKYENLPRAFRMKTTK